MSNIVVIIMFANDLAAMCRPCSPTRLVLEGYDLVDIISFATGTDESLTVNMQEASSMAHGIDFKPRVGITGSVIYATLSVFNLI